MGDRIRFSYEDGLGGENETGVVSRLLTDEQEGLGTEIQDYASGWLEVLLNDSNAGPSQIMHGTDGKHYLNGRPVQVTKL